MKALCKLRSLRFALGVTLALALICAAPARAARLKDVAEIEGVRGNQLYGFGVVVGLNGTGDGNGVEFTVKGLSNMLEQMGIRVNPNDIKVKNVASVMVTSTLPPFARPGTTLDVTLSSLGDAKSLKGGTLLLTPLKGADGNVYAVSQGPVSVGGFSVEGGGDSAQRNHPTVGRISSGATVERSIPFDLFQSRRIRVVLRNPDFTTVTRLVDQVNNIFDRPLAVAVDGGAIEIPLVGSLAKDPIGLLAKLEHVEIDLDVGARVIVNERTGTIIMGDQVRIGRVALAHGNLNIAIRSETQVSQPPALAEGGETAIVNNADIQIGEEQSGLSIVGGEVTLGDLVGVLNALGATPRDLISIFSALKQAGALHAELVIM